MAWTRTPRDIGAIEAELLSPEKKLKVEFDMFICFSNWIFPESPVIIEIKNIY